MLELEGKLDNYIVTETVFDPTIPLEVVTAFIKQGKTTGKITTEVNMSQGGSQSIKVVERTKLTDDQSEQVRQILGWDGK